MFAGLNSRKTSYSSDGNSKKRSSDCLPASSSDFIDMFNRCENARTKLVGTYCPSAKILSYNVQYFSLQIQLSSAEIISILGEANVKLLIEAVKSGRDLGFDFPFSDAIPDNEDSIVIKCKTCGDAMPSYDIAGKSIPVVIIPTAYKPFGEITKPGISFRVTTFIEK